MPELLSIIAVRSSFMPILEGRPNEYMYAFDFIVMCFQRAHEMI